MQDSRGASFVNDCETAAAQGARICRGHVCGGEDAVSPPKASETVRMGMP